MRLSAQVVVTSNIPKTIEILEQLRTDESLVEIVTPSFAEDSIEGIARPSYIQKIITEKASFSVKDAALAIEKAYMASNERVIIILGDKVFSPLVQNKLLKVIEEPPKNKAFILLTESKSTILSTIKSRLPITVLKDIKDEEGLGLDILQLSLGSVYEFVQTHKRTDAKAMRILIERLVKEVMTSQQYHLDTKTLTLFSNSTIALDMGSPPQFVLNALLLKLLARKKR